MYIQGHDVNGNHERSTLRCFVCCLSCVVFAMSLFHLLMSLLCVVPHSVTRLLCVLLTLSKLPQNWSLALSLFPSIFPSLLFSLPFPPLLHFPPSRAFPYPSPLPSPPYSSFFLAPFPRPIFITLSFVFVPLCLHCSSILVSLLPIATNHSLGHRKSYIHHRSTT